MATKRKPTDVIECPVWHFLRPGREGEMTTKQSERELAEKLARNHGRHELSRLAKDIESYGREVRKQVLINIVLVGCICHERGPDDRGGKCPVCKAVSLLEGESNG